MYSNKDALNKQTIKLLGDSLVLLHINYRDNIWKIIIDQSPTYFMQWKCRSDIHSNECKKNTWSHHLITELLCMNNFLFNIAKFTALNNQRLPPRGSKLILHNLFFPLNKKCSIVSAFLFSKCLINYSGLGFYYTLYFAFVFSLTKL